MILIKPSHKIEGIWGNPCSIEESGRTCYKSEDKITEESSEKFIIKIIKSGHYSVIEHSLLSVRFICDRGVTHELVRHRLCAFSQESTRYCNYKGGVTFVIPPWVEYLSPGQYESGDYSGLIGAEYSWADAMYSSECWYLDLLDCGWSPQQARSVLPNSLKTEIVVTANFREWRHIFKLRCSKAAHPQMREIMIPLLEEMKRLRSVFFNDITY